MHLASSSVSYKALLQTLLSLLTINLLSISGAHAAITTPVNRNNDYVEANSKNTFCFYPKAVDPSNIDVACVGGTKGDFASVMEKHLNTTTSINYFSGSLERLGGPEWVYNSGGRKIYLCLSGRAGDYSYQTMCTTVTKDNSLGSSTTPFCKVQTAQKRVTDGCYVPNQPAPTLTIATTPRAAVVTVTKSSTATTSTITRTSAAASAAAASEGVDNAGVGLSGYLLLGGFNLFIYSSLVTLYWL
ncbi:hypothetical protein D9611_010114 [Ephemerocybe angulata]|uniref:Uncharacterized protein n=1 Tax=Ephemerocybe angulata TaxID=980116 RepID=A0A8H5EVJ0_9AGAR|nr:hypothetical protein D9611_010114 [Tulosesus angulatus]